MATHLHCTTWGEAPSQHIDFSLHLMTCLCSILMEETNLHILVQLHHNFSLHIDVTISGSALPIQVEPSCAEIVSCELPASYLPTVQHAMLPNVPSPASPTPLTNGNNSTPRHTKCGVMEEQPEPDLTYVTERILAVLLPQHSHSYATTRTETNTTSPSITNNSISHRQMAELASMLRSKHGNNYLVLNLSGSQQESEKLHPQVQEYAWPAQHAPPLDVLCSVCKAMDSWLHSDPKHITVIQTKGSKGQLGVVIAAYMYYNSICACADQALDRYAMHRFYDDQVAAESQPSQRRYVGYFSQLLSGRVKVNSQPLFLHGLLLHQLPSLSPAGGCRPFIKIYQALQLIYTSEVFEVPPEMDLLCINIVPGLPLKGDIMVVCYHMLEQGRKREAVFRMQFHTCVVQNFSPLVLRKAELDNACTDARFPDEGSLELIFSPDPDTPPDTKLFGNNSGIRVNNRKSDPIVRWDSYLDFSTTEMQSTSGECECVCWFL
uniref:Uncharacterized protein n=2 Tax=Eptatretus burgeri TaxID=7764 RepID=A0A8C4QV15_EPTBU